MLIQVVRISDWEKDPGLTMVDRVHQVRSGEFKASDVIEVLESIGREHGFPKAIRVDQGTEFVSRDLDLRAYQRGVTLNFFATGQADGQSIYSKPERKVPGRVLEHTGS